MQKKGCFGQFWYMLGPIIIQNIVVETLEKEK